MSKKLTTEQFIEKAKSIHGNRYDYSSVNYINSNTKITIICNIHGTFTQSPLNHTYNKSNCPKCGDIKQKNTNLERYGTENPSQNKKIQEKRTNTILKKYGVMNAFQNDDIKDKIKATNIERYGVKHPAQNKEIQEKTKKTNLERYGVEYAQQNVKIKNKSKKTNLERYGVENPTQNKEIYAKVKATMIARYGVNYALQNKNFKNKSTQTNIERYGVLYHTQSHMLDILPLIEDKEWLFEQYITLNKTAQQIANELNINNTTVGNYLKQHEIEIRYTVGHSRKCIAWLESIIHQDGIFIQHAGNIGEYLIPGTRFKVDGYCQETNTVYEFHGDIFHGNPDLFEDKDTPNFYDRTKTAKELYDATIERENKIKSLGYNLITIWENDFNKIYY